MLSAANQAPRNQNQKAELNITVIYIFSEGPHDIEKGTHQITPEEAKTINSYKFTYDETGRLVSVEYVRGDVLLGYSDMGNASKITYTYSDGMQTKHFFDSKNEPVESQGVYAYQYIT